MNQWHIVTLLILATASGCQHDTRDTTAACPRCEPQATCAPAPNITAAAVTSTANAFEALASAAVPLDIPPTSRPSASLPAGPDYLSVDIDAHGNCWVDGAKAASCEEVGNAAKAALAKNPDVRATIRADASVTHGMVMLVLDRLKQGGINKVAFGVVRAP